MRPKQSGAHRLRRNSLSRLCLTGLTPNILLRHHRVKNHVDWLHSFRRTAASIGLEHGF